MYSRQSRTRWPGSIARRLKLATDGQDPTAVSRGAAARHARGSWASWRGGVTHAA